MGDGGVRYGMSGIANAVDLTLCGLLAGILWLSVITGPVAAQAVPKTVTDQAIALSDTALKDFAKGNPAAIFARFDRQMKRGVSAGQFAASMKQQAAQFGAIATARAHAVTVYRGAELLLAVDFSGKTSKAVAVCGFFVWSGADKRDFMIRRVEMNYLPPALIKEMGARNAASLMAQFRCPPGLIRDLTGVVVTGN